jgi:hypothetical protein
MKMQLSNVSVEKVEVVNSKKNTGGAFAKIKLCATMTKDVRRRMGIGTTDQDWPSEGESAGKLTATFEATRIVLTAKQGNTLGDIEEADIAISLANGFTWSLEDPKDEANKTVLYTFWARSSDLDAAQLMVAYKFSVSSGSSTGTLVYNKLGDGTAVDMSGDADDAVTDDGEEPAQGTLASAREAAGGTHAKRHKA